MHNKSMPDHTLWMPLKNFGLTHDFWTIQADTILSTWFILLLIFCFSWYISRCLKNETSLIRFATIQYVRFFKDLIEQSIKIFHVNDLAMIGSLFTFILICNTIQFIPWLEEPTKDINTTLALGLISFFYVHATAIKVKGLWHYIKHYFEPFFIMFPLHIIENISTIISLSFRLFGNIFGGYIITSLYTHTLSGSMILQTLGLITGANFLIFLLFGIAEGLIQAFVFTMLTLTYLSLNSAEDEDEEKISESATKQRV